MQTLIKKTSFLIALSVMTAPLSPVYGAFDFGNAGGNPTDGGQGTPTTDPVVETPTDTSHTPDTSGNPTGGQGGNPTDGQGGNPTDGNPTDGGQGNPTPSTGNSGIVGTVKGAASKAADWAGDHKVATAAIGAGVVGAGVLGTAAGLAVYSKVKDRKVAHAYKKGMQLQQELTAGGLSAEDATKKTTELNKINTKLSKTSQANLAYKAGLGVRKALGAPGRAVKGLYGKIKRQ